MRILCTLLATITALLAGCNTSTTPSSNAPMVVELINKAQMQAQSGDFKDAYATLKTAESLDKTNRGTLIGLVQIGHDLAIQSNAAQNDAKSAPLFLESAKFGRQLMALGSLMPQEKEILGIAMYNEGCVFSKTGKTDEAVKSIGEAIELGFNDLKLLNDDTDLVAIRRLDSFQGLQARIEAKQLEELANEKKNALVILANHKPFDFDFELPDLDGNLTRLADLKGKVVIVDIWGTWCPPCRMEIPHFVELHNKYKDKGFEIIGINYENGDPSQAVALIKQFMTENNMPYTCVIGDDETRKKVRNFQGFPTTIFIDRTGKVRLKEVGYKPLIVLEAIVSTLLDEPSVQ
jgi:thiol-disulfide isomerase/thioredoxin